MKPPIEREGKVNKSSLPKSMLAAALLLGLITTAFPGQAEITTKASHAILMDYDTGAVLLTKNPDVQMPPASMSKLMTIYMLLKRLKDGRISIDDEFPVSKKAWKMGGSKMFVEVNTRIQVGDLLRGIIVQSGNDACIVVAEGISGTEEDFAADMTKVAHELGLEGSSFRNASGWPDPDHHVSPRNLAMLARILISEFPDYYPIFSEREFTYSKIKQGNRNPLLYGPTGADGLKTGHTKASGYGLVASAKRGDRRLILVVNGLNSVNERARESERLLNLGFAQYKNVKVLDAGEAAGQAEVWLGNAPTVPLVLDKALKITVPTRDKDKLKVTLEYQRPLPAPLKKGQAIGNLRVQAPGMEDLTIPLLAGADVPKLGMFSQIWPKFKRLVLSIL